MTRDEMMSRMEDAMRQVDQKALKAYILTNISDTVKDQFLRGLAGYIVAQFDSEEETDALIAALKPKIGNPVVRAMLGVVLDAAMPDLLVLALRYAFGSLLDSDPDQLALMPESEIAPTWDAAPIPAPLSTPAYAHVAPRVALHGSKAGGKFKGA